MHENFFHKVKVYYEDTDTGGVVYYANYLKFLERARTEALFSIGYSNKKIKVEGKFQIIPSEFKISLPSFMLIEMEDYLDISFSLYFDK